MTTNYRKLMGHAGLLYASVSLFNLIEYFLPHSSFDISWLVWIGTIATPAASGFFAFSVFLYARSLSKRSVSGD